MTVRTLNVESITRLSGYACFGTGFPKAPTYPYKHIQNHKSLLYCFSLIT
jgi:hypothetical protein